VRGKTNAHAWSLGAALLLFVAGLSLQPMTESDLFFRLQVGREILSTRALLERNLFSFTAPDFPDLDLSWAFEVAVALLYRVAGFPAVVVAKAIWLGATFAGAFAVCRRRGAGPLASTLALAGAAWVMRERFVERPHVVSFAGEVMVLGVQGALGRRWARGWIAAVAVVLLIWANMHAGIFAGVLLALLAAAGARPTDRGKARRALLLAAAIAAAAAITPAGPVGIIRYLGMHVTIPKLHPIDEFRSATWRSDAPFLVWLAVLVAVVGASVVANRRIAARAGVTGGQAWRWRPLLLRWLADLLPALGMIILGLASVRFSADAALVSAPLMAAGLSSVFAGVTGGEPRARVVALGRTAAVVLSVGLIAATLAPRLADARAGRSPWDVDVDTSGLPLAALRFVEENGLRERMYNDFETGSYLLFEGYPRYRVFVDPRLPAYPVEMHELLGSFDLDRATWGAAMTRYGVETALLSYAGVNRRVAWWDPAQWALVYRASDARVFVRRRERWRELIAAREIPATFAFTVERGAVTLTLDDQPALSPVSACEWQRRLGDLAFDLDGGQGARAQAYFERALEVPGCLPSGDEAALASWMGAIEREAPDASHAIGHLNRALVLSPGDTRTRANRAIVLERIGRHAQAAADWDRVAVDARGTPLGEAAIARSGNLRRNLDEP
jgi:hypothetical protein